LLDFECFALGERLAVEIICEMTCSVLSATLLSSPQLFHLSFNTRHWLLSYTEGVAACV